MRSSFKKALILMACSSLFFMLSCDEKDTLSEFEKNALFAVPSKTETDSIFANWQKRDLNPSDYNSSTFGRN